MAATTILTRARARLRALVALVLLLALAVGCSTVGMSRAPAPTVKALRISDVAGEGDPTRRASNRIVINGLASSPPEQGLSHYERAIQIDATNPYAYLALAAYEVQWGDVERGVQALEQSEVLLESEGAVSPRVEPPLIGLQGRAKLRGYDAAERSTGEQLLGNARRMAPDVWGDGWLGVAELR